jgi:hypothetical protein
VKSQSGPAGKIADNRFIFDQVRTRFVYPQDRTLTVYFEWEGPAGDHTLSAYWKDPDGRVASISPEVRMETKTQDLHAYWIYDITPEMKSGIWTSEVRIDGEPSGSHSFELVIPERPKAPEPAAEPKLPTLDEIYRSAGKSMVWIYKTDVEGRRVDTSIGFVTGQNQVTTAFQSVDGAVSLELEFADGRKEVTVDLWNCNRLQDWAVVKADTGKTPPLKRMASGTVPVGERYLVFNVEGEGSRVIGGVDISGSGSVPNFGDRIQISPSPSLEAAGGPLLTPDGLVAGVVGGSTSPGWRFGKTATALSPGLWSRLHSDHSVTPIGAVPAIDTGKEPLSLRALLERGVLTAPVVPSPSLVFGGTAKNVSKKADDMTTNDTSEFSHRDAAVIVYTMWQKKEKTGKGFVSAKIYDINNRVLIRVGPKKVSLSDGAPSRLSFDIDPQSLPAGVYRADVFWNDQPAWRTYFRVND